MSVLADIIEQNSEALLEHWTRQVDPALESGSPPETELRDHIPLLLKELVDVLHRGVVPATSVAGQEHGRQRYRLGFDLPTVVREYRLLSEDILELAERSVRAVPLGQVRVFNAFIASAIAEAVAEHERQRARAKQDTERRHSAELSMDFSDFRKMNQIDRDAIRAMLDAMAGTNKPFVGTNGTLVVAHPGRVALETDESSADSPLSVRFQAERLVVDAAKQGVRSSVIRLAPTVHGAGDKGFIAMLIHLASEKKAAGYIDEGHLHWPAVHRDDAARLYRLALENAPPGTVLHGTAEEGITMRASAETIAQGIGVPTKSVPAAEAGAHFGWMSIAVGLDNRVSNQATRELLGWKPERPGLLDDMRAHYF